MQLQTVLCYSYIYDNISKIYLKTKHELYIKTGSARPPPPREKFWVYAWSLLS
jgi:hypothetical protein